MTVPAAQVVRAAVVPEAAVLVAAHVRGLTPDDRANMKVVRARAVPGRVLAAIAVQDLIAEGRKVVGRNAEVAATARVVLAVLRQHQRD